MTALAHNPQNDTRYDQYVAKVKEYASDVALGELAKPRFAVATAIAAQDRVISLDRDKKTKRDDIDDAYDLWVKTHSKKNPDDHTAGGRVAKASELRAIAIAASKTTADFVHAIRDRMPDMLKTLNEAKIECLSLYAAMVKAARTQKAQDDDLSDDQLRDALTKAPAKDKEALKELEAIKKRIERLASGDVGVKCEHPDLLAAGKLVGNCILAELAIIEQAELAALAAKYGQTVVPVVTQ